MTLHTTKTGLAGVSAAALLLAGPDALGQNYDHSYQAATGQPAQFDMIGPATTGDSEGDALIQSVTMPNGDVYSTFYRPTGVSHFAFSGDGRKFSARAGANSTVGINTTTQLKAADGNSSSNTPSAADISAMPALILAALETENLNNYIDTSNNNGWQFVMTFDLPLKDNDADPDDFGELLYFERGSGGGNSWITFLAVDENNVALPGATPLAISPAETVLTTPRTVLAGGQDMGAVAIDLSRLGVSETSYLRVSSATPGEGGYTSGENRADFKVMAVITHPDQLTTVSALYD